MSVCRLNYSQTANYADIEGITVSAIDFDKTVGFNFTSLHARGFEFLEYFLERGYTAGVDIRIASYDWRFAPGMYIVKL